MTETNILRDDQELSSRVLQTENGLDKSKAKSTVFKSIGNNNITVEANEFSE